ncbi:MAG: hypothetical protein QUV05_13045, partial [Phycisphaerae bacterium]|nr:hypothetical protein [Phycisphaerae bacterium]
MLFSTFNYRWDNFLIFATEEVKREIWRVDDALKSGLEPRAHFFRPIDNAVIDCLQTIYKDES